MKKTLRVVALVTVVALSSWPTNVEADSCGDDYRACTGYCDTLGPGNEFCYQDCGCFLAFCRGWVDYC